MIVLILTLLFIVSFTLLFLCCFYKKNILVCGGSKMDVGGRLFVGGIPRHWDQRSLQDIFDRYGTILDIYMKEGYGFVEFDRFYQAENAIHGTRGGRKYGERLIVEFANKRTVDNNDRIRILNFSSHRRRSISPLRRERKYSGDERHDYRYSSHRRGRTPSSRGTSPSRTPESQHSSDPVKYDDQRKDSSSSRHEKKSSHRHGRNRSPRKKSRSRTPRRRERKSTPPRRRKTRSPRKSTSRSLTPETPPSSHEEDGKKVVASSSRHEIKSNRGRNRSPRKESRSRTPDISQRREKHRSSEEKHLSSKQDATRSSDEEEKSLDYGPSSDDEIRLTGLKQSAPEIITVESCSEEDKKEIKAAKSSSSTSCYETKVPPRGRRSTPNIPDYYEKLERRRERKRSNEDHRDHKLLSSRHKSSHSLHDEKEKSGTPDDPPLSKMRKIGSRSKEAGRKSSSSRH